MSLSRSLMLRWLAHRRQARTTKQRGNHHVWGKSAYRKLPADNASKLSDSPLVRTPAWLIDKIPSIVPATWLDIASTSTRSSDEYPLRMQQRATNGAFEATSAWRSMAQTVEERVGLRSVVTTAVDQRRSVTDTLSQSQTPRR